MNLSPLYAAATGASASARVGDSGTGVKGGSHFCCRMRPSKASLLAATAAKTAADEPFSSDYLTA